MMKISVIVPVFNEISQLTFLVPVLNQLNVCVDEIIIVDGGSTDGTQDFLSEAGFQPLTSVAGRARQMNYGASVAKGDLLWFLHADTRLVVPANQYVAALATAKESWGRFDIKLSGRNTIFRVVEWMINKRSAWTGIATGDQGIFIQRALFLRVCRYDDIAIMEDIGLCKKLKKITSPAIVSSPRLETSSRRWEQRGVIRTILLMWKMRWLYFRGVSADKLSRLYNK